MATKVLNTAQIEAIQYGKGPLLIVAGAGTGKTTVITERIKHLVIDEKISPSNILALTFTEKAATEMEERIDIAMPYGYTQMWIATFHAFCDRILRNEAIHIGLNPNYKLTTEAESILFLRDNLFKLDLSYFRPMGNPTKFITGMLQHFSRLKDEDISPDAYAEYAKSLEKHIDTDQKDIEKTQELARTYKLYEEIKTTEGMMDFSDMIANTLLLFRKRPNVLREYQEQFHYILIDEFQDTNYAQNELAILLAGKRKNITVVGDDDQAIYRWRGAAISNIIQFRTKFPKAKVITLTHNYRSTQEILDKSYQLIRYNNPDRLEIRENIDKKLIAERKTKTHQTELLWGPRVEDEVELVIKKIQKLIDTKDYTYKDIAILVRANDHAQPFVRAFERYAIPFQFLGPGQLFQQEEIKDLIAYLKILAHFDDNTSLFRVLTMPIFEIPTREIATLLNFAKKKNLTLFEALEKSLTTNDELYLETETKKRVEKFINMLHKHIAQIPKDSAGQILYFFLQDSGLLANFITPKTIIDEKRAQNIAKFFERLKSFETEHESANVYAIADWVDLSMQMGESPQATSADWTENNAVNILTIHSSKGLEFPIVFLVNLVTQRFPTRDRREQIPIPQELIKEILPVGDYHLQEERRLFYVGMTRARDRLFLTAANYYGEGKRERKISPFVIESLGEDKVLSVLTHQRAEKLAVQPSLLDWKPLEQTISTAETIAQPTIIPITYLSYSQIQTYDVCPLHYKLKYLLKIPTPPSAAQSFGTSLHSALRDFYFSVMRKEDPTLSDARAFLEYNWIEEGYTSAAHKQKALVSAKKILSSYLENNYDPHTANPLAVEVPFKFFIDKKLAIGGRIDRVDGIENNKIEIIDYKTGNTIPTDKEMLTNLQLTTYATAITEIPDKLLNRNADDIILSLYYLEQEKKLTTTRSESQLEEAKKLYLSRAQEIGTSSFLCSKSPLCLNCEYKMICSTFTS